MESVVGFEPTNIRFAVGALGPLGHTDKEMEEAEGFEPSEGTPLPLSKRAPSTARPRLHCGLRPPLTAYRTKAVSGQQIADSDEPQARELAETGGFEPPEG